MRLHASTLTPNNCHYKHFLQHCQVVDFIERATGNEVGIAVWCRTRETKIETILSFFMEPLSEVFNDLIASAGCCCFSRGSDTALRNNLMWAHYADGLRGFCLVFDSDQLHQSLCDLNKMEDLVLVPVHYTKSFPSIDIYRHMNQTVFETDNYHSEDDLYFPMYTTKAPDWRYEREWRAISQRQTLHSYAPDALVEICIGERMPKDQRRKIEGIAAHLPRARLSEIRMGQEDYQLSIHRTL